MMDATDTTDTTRTDNGYGLSVIADGYGSDRGFMEVAIIHDGQLCYATDIMDDVRGWCTAEDVASIRDMVDRLPRLDGCSHDRPMMDDDDDTDDTEDTT